MIRKSLLSVACLMACLPLAAASRDFASIDADNDGYINAEEAQAMPGLSGLFLAIDTDKDGKISSDEYDIAITGGAKTNKGYGSEG